MRRFLILGGLLTVVPPLAAQKPFFQDVSWSPDNEWLAFTEVATGEPWTSNILVMRPNGKKVRLIPHGQLSARWAAWHPDGGRLAFAGEIDNNWEIFVIDLESEAVTRLTDTSVDESAPSWSPDGSQLVFTARINDRSQIFRMNVDGSDRINLSQNDRNDWNPSWSPIANQIVYFSAQDTAANHLFLMRSDGTDQRQLTTGHLKDMFPSWAVDGSRIVFTRSQTGTIGVYQIAVTGSVPEEVASPAFYGRVSPDGSRVAFIKGEWPKSAIYVGGTDEPDYKVKRIRH